MNHIEVLMEYKYMQKSLTQALTTLRCYHMGGDIYQLLWFHVFCSHLVEQCQHIPYVAKLQAHNSYCHHECVF